MHKTQSEPIKQFECYICNSGWSTLDKMLKHFQNHGIKRDNKCEICSQMLSLDELKMHICCMETNIKCEYCIRSFNVTSELLQHLTEDHDDKIRYICRKCNRFFEMKYLRDLHETQHKSVEQHINFLCEICSKGFEKETTLEEHLKSHSDESEKYYLISIYN